MCAAAAMGSGRPGRQMGFSSHSYLRKRRLKVKDVTLIFNQSELLAMGGASFAQGTRSLVGRKSSVASLLLIEQKKKTSASLLQRSGP